MASDIEYAHSLGIEVGGYDLIALTRVVQQQWMAVNNDEYPRLENSLYIMQVKFRTSSMFGWLSIWYEKVPYIQDFVISCGLSVTSQQRPS